MLAWSVAPQRLFIVPIDGLDERAFHGGSRSWAFAKWICLAKWALVCDCATRRRATVRSLFGEKANLHAQRHEWYIMTSHPKAEEVVFRKAKNSKAAGDTTNHVLIFQPIRLIGKDLLHPNGFYLTVQNLQEVSVNFLRFPPEIASFGRRAMPFLHTGYRHTIAQWHFNVLLKIIISIFCVMERQVFI